MNSAAQPSVRSPAGFSTIAAIVYLTLVGLLMAPLIATVVSAQRGFVEANEAVETTGSVRFAHLALTRQIRMAGSHPMGPKIGGIDPDPNGNGSFDDVRVRADYNPPDGDTDDVGEDLTFYVSADTLYVLRQPSATVEPYVVGIDSLKFEYYDREGLELTDVSKIQQRAIGIQVTVHGQGEPLWGEVTEREVTGYVRLRNSGG